MRKYVLGLLFVLLPALAALPPVAAQGSNVPPPGDRVALVVGNSRYEHWAPLNNPEQDAKAMATLLRDLGFMVIEKTNANRDTIEDALAELKGKARGAALAVVFYAGHGLEIDGKSILAPTDMPDLCGQKGLRRYIEIDRVFEAVAGAQRKILFLDACRNKGFPQCPTMSPNGGIPGASGFRGLARVNLAGGLLIANATSPGDFAEDGAVGQRSPFSGPLLERLKQCPSKRIDDILDLVAKDMAGKNWRQVPDMRKIGHFEPTCLSPHGCRDDCMVSTLPPPPPPPPPHVCAKPLTPAAARALQPGKAFQECDGEFPEMVVVPKGSLQMGSPENESGRYTNEGPQRRVEIARDFAIGKYEITVQQFVAFLNASAREGNFDERWVKTAREDAARQTAKSETPNPDLDSPILQTGVGDRLQFTARAGFGQHPVALVAWEGATAYTRWLSKLSGAGYRLPSEAEWEYAARAGSQSTYHFGENPLNICEYGNGADLSSHSRYPHWVVTKCNDGYPGRAPVGKFKANAFGIHDMLGNVSEWVGDCWHANYAGAPSDGSTWFEQSNGECNWRVSRGGSFNDVFGKLRIAIRFRNRIFDHSPEIGFRVVRTIHP